MRKFLIAAAVLAVAGTTALSSARADWVGATAGAGTGLVVAGPIGALAGAAVGGVFGKPYWGPAIGHGNCWTDEHFHRHCRPHPHS